MEPEVSLSCTKQPPLFPSRNQSNPFQMFTSIFEIHFNTILQTTLRFLKRSRIFTFPNSNFLCISYCFRACYIPRHFFLIFVTLTKVIEAYKLWNLLFSSSRLYRSLACFQLQENVSSHLAVFLAVIWVYNLVISLEAYPLSFLKYVRTSFIFALLFSHLNWSSALCNFFHSLIICHSLGSKYSQLSKISHFLLPLCEILCFTPIKTVGHAYTGVYLNRPNVYVCMCLYTPYVYVDFNKS
jgi:hypothetical protein